MAQASDATEYAAKPLPLFYVLSQAGRAIAAARLEGAWQLHGHGVSADTDSRRALESTVGPAGGSQTSFAAVSRAVGSERLGGATTLGELWAANPDLRDEEIRGAGEEWPRALELPLGIQAMVGPPGFPMEDRNPDTEPITTGGYVQFSLEVKGRTVGDVSSELALYPSLAGAFVLQQEMSGERTNLADDDPVQLQDYDGRQRVSIATECPHQMTHTDWWARQRAMASYVEVAQPAYPAPQLVGWALPSLGGHPSPSPLMLWWSLLYGLSALARYEPASWTAALDLEQSELAVGLERVLDLAEERVPERVWIELTAHA